MSLDVRTTRRPILPGNRQDFLVGPHADRVTHASSLSVARIGRKHLSVQAGRRNKRNEKGSVSPELILDSLGRRRSGAPQAQSGFRDEVGQRNGVLRRASAGQGYTNR